MVDAGPCSAPRLPWSDLVLPLLSPWMRQWKIGRDGQIISDGVADGYIQDLVVIPEFREKA